MAEHALDLSEVRALLDQGLDRAQIAKTTRQARANVDYAWSVVTGLPLENDPDPDSIERMTAAIRGGWTHEQEVAARRGEHRDSSSAIPRRLRPHKREGHP
jgi:hypothetical protein